MIWTPNDDMRLQVGDVSLEARCYGPAPSEDKPTLVMLHEGLGCVALWRDIPQALAEATGLGVLVYSRQGYGRSDRKPAPWPLDYMTREAVDMLPQVLKAAGITKSVLLGHSDGASIAAIYAGSVQDHGIRGVILMAPHFFTEPQGQKSIAEAKHAYETTDLKEKMARYHDHVDDVFWGWNGSWLHPTFEADWDITEPLAYIRVPVLVIQGEQDQYGTMKQVQAVVDECYCPVDVAMIPDCKHNPHLEQREQTLATITAYCARLETLEEQGSALALKTAPTCPLTDTDPDDDLAATG